MSAIASRCMNLIDRPIIFALTILTILMMYGRLYFGVDTSDEGFYMAMSSLFARGGEPFINEWVAQQGAAVIFYPVVKIYTALVGSTDGLVLFGRKAYFLVSLLAAWSIWRLCRRILKPSVALVPALIPIVFHPGGIPNISYNTLGALGLLIGTLFFLECYISKINKPHYAFFGAIFLTIATYSYPSLAIVTVFILFVFIIFSPKIPENVLISNIIRSNQFGFLLGISILSIPLIYVTLPWDLEPLLTTYKYASAAPSQGGGYLKIWGMFNSLLLSWRYGALVFALLVFLVASNLPKFGRYLAIVFGIIFLYPSIVVIRQIWQEGRLIDSSLLVVWLGLLTPIAFLFRPDRIYFKYLLIVWPLLMFAGGITAWTSSIGLPNAAIGLMPAAALTLFLSLRAIDSQIHAVRLLPAFFLLIIIALPQFRTIYQESALTDLRIRVKQGPYLGLFTGWKPTAFSEFSTDLASISSGLNSIFIYDSNPGYYLMTNLVPTGPSVWVNSQGIIPLHTRMFYEYFSQPNHLPDVLVIFETQLNENNHPLTSFFMDKGYVKMVDKLSYRIYVKP